MSKLGTTTLLLAVAISASDAQACGEVMYRMGGAMRYHAFITHHPAQILVYDGDTARRAQGANGQFRDNLERAGHKVTVVDNPDALAKALAEHPYDVVITYAADLPAIAPQIAQVAHEPSLIPVFQQGHDESLRERYPLALNEDANLNQFLKTIEQTMKGRGS